VCLDHWEKHRSMTMVAHGKPELEPMAVRVKPEPMALRIKPVSVVPVRVKVKAEPAVVRVKVKAEPAPAALPAPAVGEPAVDELALKEPAVGQLAPSAPADDKSVVGQPAPAAPAAAKAEVTPAGIVLRAVMHPTWRVIEACRGRGSRRGRQMRVKKPQSDLRPSEQRKRGRSQGSVNTDSVKREKVSEIKDHAPPNHGHDDDMLPPTHPDWQEAWVGSFL
jgi:hypothetical protein